MYRVLHYRVSRLCKQGWPGYAIYQERIIEKKGRGRECETTTHLIKIPVFTHTSRVTKFIFKTKAEKLGVSTCTAR